MTRFILTLGHPNRINGLFQLNSLFGIRNFWSNGFIFDGTGLTTGDDHNDYRTYRNIVGGIYKSGCKNITALAGYSSALCNLEVLSPSVSLLETPGIPFEDSSIVLLLHTPEHRRVLFVSNVGRRVWLEMMADSDVREKIHNTDIIVCCGREGLEYNQDVVLEWICPRLIIYSDSKYDIIYNRDLALINQLAVKDCGTIILDENDEGVSVYTSNMQYAAYMGLGRVVKHPMYEAWRIERRHND